MNDINSTRPYLYGIHNCSYIPVNNSKFSIGRSIRNSLVLEDFRVSKNHCLLEKINQRWFITDYSSNHVLVNDEKISKRSRQILCDGDVVKLSAALKYVFYNKNGDNTNIDSGNVKDKSVQLASTSTASTKGSTSGNEWECTYCTNDNISDSESITSDESKISDDDEEITYDRLLPKRSKVELYKRLPNHLEDEIHCTICTEYIIEANRLNCSHTFCKFCIKNWQKISSKCPICSKNIVTVEADPVIDNFIVEILKSSSTVDKEKYAQIVEMRKKQEENSTRACQEIKKRKIQHTNKTINEIMDDLQCVICTEVFVDAIILNCSHIFCKHCIEGWEKKSKYCPVCRIEITSHIAENRLDDIIVKIIESSTDDMKNDRNLVLENRRKQIKGLLFSEKINKIKNMNQSIDMNMEEDEVNVWQHFIRSLQHR